MSAAEPSSRRHPAGVELGACAADIVEIAAYRRGARELEHVAARRGVRFPSLGRVSAGPDHLALAVRPDRWLVLTAPVAAGAAAADWRAAGAPFGAAIDQSSGLAALHLAGPAVRETLARGCRLDLHPDVFPAWHAGASLIAQVAVIVAALPAGWLLLTPATTARHFHAWLASAARPFGLNLRSDLASPSELAASAPSAGESQ